MKISLETIEMIMSIISSLIAILGFILTLKNKAQENNANVYIIKNMTIYSAQEQTNVYAPSPSHNHNIEKIGVAAYFIISLLMIKYSWIIYIVTFTVCTLTILSLMLSKSITKTESIVIITLIAIILAIQLYFVIVFNDNYACMLFCVINLFMFILYGLVFSVRLIKNSGSIIAFTRNYKLVLFGVVLVASCACIGFEYYFATSVSSFSKSISFAIESFFSSFNSSIS